MYYINSFPVITIITALIVILLGVTKDNKDAIIAGTTIAGIAGTAYNSVTNKDDSENETISPPLQKKPGKPPSVGGDL